MLAEVDIPSLEIGTEIQDIKGMDGFRQALAQMVADSQINTDEVNAILTGIFKLIIGLYFETYDI